MRDYGIVWTSQGTFKVAVTIICGGNIGLDERYLARALLPRETPKNALIHRCDVHISVSLIALGRKDCVTSQKNLCEGGYASVYPNRDLFISHRTSLPINSEVGNSDFGVVGKKIDSYPIP